MHPQRRMPVVVIELLEGSDEALLIGFGEGRE